MAVLFTSLLGLAAILLGYFLYDFGKYGAVSDVAAGIEAKEIIASYQRLRLFCVIIIGFMLAVVLISFLISRFVVTRINNIANTAKEIINTADLSRRINIDSSWDDLSYLSNTLNQLLAKIESLMQGIRDVSDNIAHDLRTPITRLRNDLEQLKNNKTTNLDASRLVDELDKILAIFNSLLRISNIEKAKRYQAFVEVDIGNILCDVAELYEPLAEEKNISLKIDLVDRLILLGDRDLLFQMFANLVDNAIKFSDINGQVEIHCGAKEVVISDNGIGIIEAEKEKLFQRFYRSEQSRNLEGNGLGLSMVKAIADLHNFKLDLYSNNPGLKVIVKIF